MGEKATKAILKKKDSSIVVTTRLVAEGSVDGMVAAGSTGAAAVAAQLGLGRISNVERSAIAAMLPTTTKGKQVIVVDVGANVDTNANQLLQFGLMGSILAKGMQGIANPTVGLLNIGTEETKGNKLVQDTFKLLKAHKEINFIGFIEGRDFPMNKVDVVVTDGFTGNIALKTAEGIARMITAMLKQEIMSSPRTQLGGLLAKPSFEELRRRIDYNELGGALLVGVKGVCVIAHGSSKHTAIKNAVRVAKTMAAAKIIQKIEEVLSLAPAGSAS
jgi:glycerol-3-phosphate acyltransferase PlsX